MVQAGVEHYVPLFAFQELEGRKVVGTGTSCVVYSGLWQGKMFAVKVLKGQRNKRSDAEMKRERDASNKLNHPNVVKCLGVASLSGEGAHALVFELCPGGVLDVRTMGGIASKNALVILNVAIDIAKALEHAHARNVIHRDVKPSQVLINENGNALLADWGLAAMIGDIECSIPKTGTLEFVSLQTIEV